MVLSCLFRGAEKQQEETEEWQFHPAQLSELVLGRFAATGRFGSAIICYCLVVSMLAAFVICHAFTTHCA